MNQKEMCKVLTYDVLVPLHQLLATEEISQHYNYLPDRREDDDDLAWAFFYEHIQNIRKNLKKIKGLETDPFKKAMYNCDYKVWVGKGNANRKKEEGNVPEYDAKLKAKYKEVLESVSGKIYIAYNEGMCMEEYLLKKIAL